MVEHLPERDEALALADVATENKFLSLKWTSHPLVEMRVSKYMRDVTLQSSLDIKSGKPQDFDFTNNLK